MKKEIITIATIISFITIPTAAFAVGITPSVTPKTSPNNSNAPTDSADQARIEQIKDLVASRVAELKLVDKDGFLGIVQDVRNTQLTIEDESQNSIPIDTDELTKFNDSANDKFGISDMKKG